MKNPTSPQSLLQQIAQIQRMERGKLCVIRQGPNGPYYNHQCWQDGQNASRYVPPEQVPALQEAIAGYQQFQALAEQYAGLMVEKTRQEIAAGFKKKTLRRKSSWPRNKKSNS